MQDLLERALLSLVGKDYGAKCGPIQIAARRKNLGAKLLSQEPAHLIVLIRQLARGPIGVKKPRPRQLLQEREKVDLPVECRRLSR